MVNTNISKSEKIVANTRVEKIVSKFEPPWPAQASSIYRGKSLFDCREFIHNTKKFVKHKEFGDITKHHTQF